METVNGILESITSFLSGIDTKYLILGSFLLILILIAVFTKTPVIIKSKWQHFFFEYQFSSEDFYQKVEEKLKELQLPRVKFDKETFFEKHLLSAKRNYLTVTRNEFVFFISSAHFGTGSFVSWWFTEEREGILNKLPFISKWLLGRNRKKKTLYQMDSEAMFKAAIHSVVLEVVEEMTKFNVQRPLSDIERQFTDLSQ
ncbi:MAG: hypothetical protein JNM67_05890 [Bacteroidetes bacterium]|nr:hypothetical protein [Bacteroidota bacterium]